MNDAAIHRCKAKLKDTVGRTVYNWSPISNADMEGRLKINKQYVENILFMIFHAVLCLGKEWDLL